MYFDKVPAGVPEQLLHIFSNPVLHIFPNLVDSFELLLIAFDIRAELDVSLGSGALAEAALRMGFCYVGVTVKAAHTKRLGNVADRVTMSHMAMPARPCYQKDLASDVQHNLSQLFAGLQQSTDCEDVDMAELMPDAM